MRAAATGAAIAAVIWLAGLAGAQDAAAEAAKPQTYEAAFFERFNPVTAFDMVFNTPGFSLDNGAGRRGFGGTAGNLLINGERPSTKDDLGSFLSRIPAANVLRIELIRGGSGETDVRGQALLCNVVLKADAAPAATWQVQGRAHRGGRVSGYAEVSRTLKRGALDATLSANVYSWGGRSFRDEELRDGAGAFRERRDEFGQDTDFGVNPSMQLTWDPDGALVAHLNAKVTAWRYSFLDGSQAFASAAPDAPLARFEIDKYREPNGLNMEIGGDIETAAPGLNGATIKFVGLANRVSFDFDENFEATSPQGFIEAVRLEGARERGERILRGALSWKAGRHAIELGLEGVFNYLDKTLDIALDEGGGFEPLPLPVADARVEELRAEAFVSDAWKLSPVLALDLGFTFEASRITQTGDAMQERELSFPKPEATLTWTPAKGRQLRLRAARDVSQLDFDEFASSVSVTEGQTNIGNPDLEPERAWKFEALYEQRFAEKGVFKITGFHDEIEAVDDTVPIAGLFDGPGNLGRGRRTGLRVDATLPLDVFGLKGATLKSENLIQRTEVEDPTTGEKRIFDDEADWRYYYEFRQDLPAKKLAWGWDYFQSGPVWIFRLKELQQFEFKPGDFDVWVESSHIKGINLRVGFDSVFDPVRVRTRTFYEGDRSTGVVSAVELQDRTFGPLVYIRAKGTF